MALTAGEFQSDVPVRNEEIERSSFINIQYTRTSAVAIAQSMTLEFKYEDDTIPGSAKIESLDIHAIPCGNRLVEKISALGFETGAYPVDLLNDYDVPWFDLAGVKYPMFRSKLVKKSDSEEEEDGDDDGILSGSDAIASEEE